MDAQGLKLISQHLGFFQLGILSGATVLDGQPLLAWLANGCQADMDWMAREPDKRLSPVRLLKSPETDPENYSLICVTLPYLQPGGRQPKRSRYKIARYAMGEDYHTVLRQKLYRLLQALQEIIPERKLYGRAFVDSAPILEKPLAVLAGLGWQGKNTNLIHPQHGSYQFVGTLLVDIPFTQINPLSPGGGGLAWGGEKRETPSEEKPAGYIEKLSSSPYPLPKGEGFCGTCTRCIDACPTNAIVPVGQSWRVDARRCIAYWTIENHGDSIPDEIAQNLNGWIFGCDICQEVCPWNLKFGQETEEPSFQPRPEILGLQQEGLQNLSEDDFTMRFVGSPLLRAGYKGIKRNQKAIL